MPWYTCIVNNTGPATDGTETSDPVVYINLTDTGTPAAFVSQWFYAAAGGQNQMLAVALAAMNGGKKVQAGADPPNSGGSPFTRDFFLLGQQRPEEKRARQKSITNSQSDFLK